MEVSTWNDRFSSSSKGETNFTPFKHPTEFEGNITIKNIKHLTVWIRSDVIEFIDILKDIHETSRTWRRRGTFITVAGLPAVFLTGGLAAPAFVGAGAAVGGAAITSVAAAIEHIKTKKNIENVEKRWENFVEVFLAKYVYYCDSEDTARMILTHVKHVVYQEEDSYEFFRLLFRNRNPLVTKCCSSDSLYGYLEDATHLNQSYREAREFNISSFTLFNILDLIKLSFTLDQNSESAASPPLRNLTRFLDIVIDVVDSLPNYCDCSRYKVKLSLTYESMIQMCETAIRLAEMCKSEACNAETYRKKKREAEQKKMREDEVAKQRQIQKQREAELQKMYEEKEKREHDKNPDCEAEIPTKSEVPIPKKIMTSTEKEESEYDKHPCAVCKSFDCIVKVPISTKEEECEYDKHPCPPPCPPPCPGCKAFNCKCIEVCARCHRPLK